MVDVQIVVRKSRGFGMKNRIIVFFIFIIFVSTTFSLEVRKPAFSGRFYPANSETLKNTINNFFKNISDKPFYKNPKIIIVPHAGYRYSGKIAAEGFRQLKNEDIKNVFLIGPSHRVDIENYLILYDGDYWRTPAGKTKVNKNLVNSMNNDVYNSKINKNVFKMEHSLEVELPFLQNLDNNFQIIPMLLNSKNEEVINDLAKFLVEYLNKDGNYLVVSTDMSHYHDYQTAKKMDLDTCSLIENNKYFKLKNNLKSGDSELCGDSGVLLALRISQKMNLEQKFLRYLNSGDLTGNKTRVVGYSSFVFFESKNKKNNNIINFTEEEKRKMIQIARKSLNTYIMHKKIPNMKIKYEKLYEKRGVFVTLKKNGRLRGCLGYIYPRQKIYRAISNLAISAAVNDYRFPSVTKNELDDIDIEISILTRPKKIKDTGKIILGKHGVIIEKGNKRGVYLPQVAKETGWNKTEFLNHLCHDKAGLKKEAWKNDKSVDIYIFESLVFREKN